MIFMPYEKEILEKFKTAQNVLTKEEKEVVDKWTSVGFVHCGYNWSKKCGTAKLSDEGLIHLYKQ